MKLGKILRPKSLHLHHQPTDHWKDSDEMHEVIHSFPGYFKALLLELLDQPMSREEIAEAMRQLEVRMAAHHKRDFAKADLDQEIAAAVECGVLEEQKGKYVLTPGGREIAEHYQPRKLFIKANVIFREKLWHSYMYPKVTIDDEKCTQCGKCVRDCPVLHFEKKGKEAIVTRKDSSCIHCFNCVKGCPAHAIGLTGNLEKGREFMGKMSAKANTETPLSAVYPLAAMA